MSKVFITEYKRLGVDSLGNPTSSPEEPGTDQTPITSSGTSQQSAAFDAQTTVVEIHSDGIISIAFGTNPTATVNNRRIPADVTRFFAVKPNSGLKVAVIDNT